jgi:hypothetical protein
MQMNIPWARTLTGGPDELPFTINTIDGQTYARSSECTRSAQLHGLSCPPCMGLELRVCELGETITTYKKGTRKILMTTVQLHLLAEERRIKITRWKHMVSTFIT